VTRTRKSLLPMATARTCASLQTTRSLTAGRRGRLMTGNSRLHRTAVGTATRFFSWTLMAPIRAWSRTRKAAERRRAGLRTAKRSILQIALRKITERIAKFSQLDYERTDVDERRRTRPCWESRAYTATQLG